MSGIYPTLASGHATAEHVRNHGFGAEHVIAEDYIEKLIDFPAIQNATGPANLLGQGTGTPALAEIASSEICGLTLDANDESFGFLWYPKPGIDWNADVGLAVDWSESGTGASGSALFAITYTALTIDTTAVAVGATALDTVIVADTPSATANCLQRSSFGLITGGTLSADIDTVVYAVKCAVTLTTISDATAYAVVAKFDRRYI